MSAHAIWIAERSRLFRQGLAMLMTGHGFHVTREIQHMGFLDLEADAGPAPAIIIASLETDLEPGGEEAEALVRICRLGVPVVVLSDDFALHQLVQAMTAGAQGYLMKDISPAALIQSLHLVLSGEKVLPTDLVATLLNGKGVQIVSERNQGILMSLRETHILSYLAEGYPNKRIAHELNMAESLVKFEVKKIFRKIRARNRTEAALWARGKPLSRCVPQEVNTSCGSIEIGP